MTLISLIFSSAWSSAFNPQRCHLYFLLLSLVSPSLPSFLSIIRCFFFSLSPSLFLFPPLVVNSGNCCHLSSFHPLERFNWYLAKCAARLLLLKVGSEKQIKEKKSGISKRKKASSHLFEENQFTCDRAKQGKTKTTPGFYWRALPVTPNQTIHSLYSLL